MMRAYTWPPTSHDAPTLWEQAKAMFSALTTRFGSAMRLACRRFLTLQQRRYLILHIEPVERLVRVLMIVEAITLLVMTPMGLKLRQTTRPYRIPDPPLQVGAHKPHPEANRIQAAMMTIAAHQPRIDARVAEREAREGTGARRSPGVSAPALRQLRPSRSRQPLHRHPLDSRPRHAHRALKAAAQLNPRRHHPARILRASARRFAALQRVLANPWPAIRRLARRIAAIPREDFSAPWQRRYRAVRWAHGRREFYDACILATPAFAALDRAYGMPPKVPG
jgi:hypothetical protein